MPNTKRPNTDTDKEMRSDLGLFYKVNPPIRNRRRVEKLRRYLKEGKIDWLETDHAPLKNLSRSELKQGGYFFKKFTLLFICFPL